MHRKEYFRLGLEYLLSLEKKGANSNIARCAGLHRSNFTAMLKGRRPFPEAKRARIARCMGLSERDLERMGMDLSEGLTESVHFQKVLAKKILFPEPAQEPDLDVYAWDPETMEMEQIGEAWSVEKATIIAQFERVPEHQVRYVFKPKPVIEAPTSQDEDRAESE